MKTHGPRLKSWLSLFTLSVSMAACGAIESKDLKDSGSSCRALLLARPLDDVSLLKCRGPVPTPQGDQGNWERKSEAGGDGARAEKSVASEAAADMASPGELGGAVASSVGSSAPVSGGQSPASAGVLTAGSFNDGLNLETFLEFFLKSPLAQPQDQLLGLWSSDWQAAAPAVPEPEVLASRTRLEISFVVDTTGSMADELAWLQADFKELTKRIASEFASLTPLYSLVVYRDAMDEYVTRGFGFTSDVNLLAGQIAAQSANGGGDFPEALDLALSETALNLQWSDGAHKLAFVIADAPPHADRMTETFAAVQELKNKGVRIFPVAASGTDDTTEAVFRAAALVTGGHYLFLTDDSGVGNPHAEPHFPCYHVERLSDAVMRSIRSALSGKHVDPEAGTIVRTVGRPSEGRCLPPETPVESGEDGQSTK